MTQMGFLLEQQYCMGCQTCMHACRTRHGVQPGTYPRTAESYQLKFMGPYLSMSCNHCDNPACVAACPTTALQKREKDGIVVHDPSVCIGCFACKMACPYDAPKENPLTGTMIKCDMCAARQDKGDTPACVLACPMKVLTYDTVDNIKAKGGVRSGVGYTEASTGPNFYIIPIKEQN